MIKQTKPVLVQIRHYSILLTELSTENVSSYICPYWEKYPVRFVHLTRPLITPSLRQAYMTGRAKKAK